MRPDPLKVSVRVLRASIVINWIYGLLILALLIASLVAKLQVMDALGAHRGPGSDARIAGLRLIAVLGLVSIYVNYVILSKLLAAVRTVTTGEPFLRDNAARMRTIAWALLALEVLRFFLTTTASITWSDQSPIDLNSDFSLTRWIVLLLLFVLANVFDEAARMREDLEGTV